MVVCEVGRAQVAARAERVRLVVMGGAASAVTMMAGVEAGGV